MTLQTSPTRFAARVRRAAAIAAAAIAGCLPLAAGAGSLTVESRSIPGLTPKSSIVSHRLRLTGMIETPDADRLRTELVRLQARRGETAEGPLAVIELSSKGGNMLEGIKIGALLREFDVATVVRRDDLCLSACALAFLGGSRGGEPSRTLEIGGQVGFHNFSVNVGYVLTETRSDPAAGIARGFQLARTGAAEMMRYVTEMGVDPAFVANLISLPAEQWQYVETASDFLMLGIEPKGQLPAAGRLEAQAANACSMATGGRLPADPARVRRVPVREAQRRLLEQVRNHVARVDLKGPLAVQLSAVLETSDSRLIENVYADLKNAGIALPDLAGSHFEMAADGGRLQCHVTLSPGDLERLDLVLLTDRGPVRTRALPASSLARLARYGRDDTLNPPAGRSRDVAALARANGQLTNAD